MQCLPELVTKNIKEETIFAVPKVKELSSEVFSGDVSVGCGNADISDGDDSIKAIVEWQGPNKIDCNGITMLIQNRKWVKGTCRFGDSVLNLLALCARWNVGFKEIMSHVGPVV